MQKNTTLMWVIAAALASAGVHGDEEAGVFGLHTAFAQGAERTEEGYVRTSGDYAIRIDRLVVDSSRLNLSVEDRRTGARTSQIVEVGGELDAMVPHTMDEALSLGSREHLALTLNGVFVEGRVYDLKTGPEARLPHEGVGISGTLPIEVKVKRFGEGAVATPHDVSGASMEMAVEFELPEAFLDGIDWSAFS
ncbi:MAG: hypothetical protein AAGI01_01350 [Myxococcota bacterium]